MKNQIFTLVPARVQYKQFWVAIGRRNLWLIMLRYAAVCMLISLIVGLFAFENFNSEFSLKKLPLIIITICILGYNIIFHRIWKKRPQTGEWKNQFHSLHFSLLQICCDLIALMLFCYFTGGVESPIIVFFIFHVIIGSLFLPGSIIAIIISVCIIIMLIGAILEYNSIITHYGINGLLNFSLYTNSNYIITYFLFFNLAIFISIYLANSISKELYQRERSMYKAFADLESAEEAKSRYVMTIVHDLKTPIAAAITYLSMLLDGTMGEVKPEHIKPLERSKLRLGGAIETINNILQIARLKLEEKSEEVHISTDISEIFEDIFRDMRVLFRSKNLKFEIVKDNNEKYEIISDPKLLKLAFSNLLSNAYKYTENDGVVEVLLNKTKEHLILKVADTGIGIPEKEIGKIFDDFYRSQVSKKKGIEGTGLGLSLVVRIINKYNGVIDVKSPSYLMIDDKKPGTEFTITFPIS